MKPDAHVPKDLLRHGTDDPFYVGFSMSVYQSSGHDHSSWGEFGRSRTWYGGHTIQGNQQCGESCNFWELFDADIERAASLGANCFRISLEWSRIEPEKGEIDSAAVQRYHDIIDSLERHKIVPFVSLHHFVHPIWFEHLGGFQKEENIAFFVDYAKLTFRLFGSRIKYWSTFNEPGIASFAGLMSGTFPPGKILRIAGTARHLLHMLQAHTRAYEAIKAMPGGDAVLVGIVHNFFWFEPKQAWWVPSYVRTICKFLNLMWGNDTVLEYLRTGKFESKASWFVPGVYYQNPTGRPGCDFFGLNYYSRGVIDWKLMPSCQPGETMTDMPYALHPDGLKKALHSINRLDVPIYITELGVADSGDDMRRKLIEGYMPKVAEAMEEGCDVRGVLYWSLIDNFEWQMGFKMKFGIYNWDNDGSQKRTLRDSGKLLTHWFKRLTEYAAGKGLPVGNTDALKSDGQKGVLEATPA